MTAERVRLTEAQRRDLTALAERVEGLAGACRETDVLIVQALYPDIGPCEPHCAGDTPIFWNDPLYKKPCPPLTASLDAVVALIERELPGCGFVVSKNAGGNKRSPCIACIEQDDDRWTYEGWPQCLGATPALALLAATLRALALKED